MTIDEIAQKLSDPKFKTTPFGTKVLARCPAHNDENPSFAIWEMPDGYLHVKCQAGCTEKQIMDALGITDRKITAYKPDPKNPSKETVYTYRDSDGSYLFEKVRYVKNGKKTFIQRVRKDDGTFSSGTASLNGKSKTLYRLPEVLEAVRQGKTIYVVEGEKAVESMFVRGLPATCQPMGAGPGKWLESHSSQLKGAEVVIVADRDDTGEKYAQEVAKQLKGHVKSIRVVQSAVTKDHADSYDHFEAGYTENDFVERTDLKPKFGIEQRTYGETFEMFEPRYLLEPWLPEGKCVLLDGDGGVGKTSLALSWAAALSRGFDPIEGITLDSGPVRTLFLHKDEDTDEELNTVFRGNNGDHKMIAFGGRDIYFNSEGLKALEETIIEGGYKLVCVDSIFYFIQGVVNDTNSALEVVKVMEGLNGIASRTKCTFFNFRHTKKGTLGSEASNLGLGTVQFRNSHRGQILLRKHPTDRGIVIATAERGSLLIEKPDFFAFRRVGVEIQRIVEAINPFVEGADDMSPSKSKKKVNKCKSVLVDLLAYGPKTVRECTEKITALKISERTMKTARMELRIEAFVGSDRQNYIKLPFGFDGLGPEADEIHRMANDE